MTRSSPPRLGSNPALPEPEQRLLAIASSLSEPDMQEVSVLLQQAHNVNARDADGMGIIHWAAINGHCQMVQQLVRYGADVNLRTRRNQLLPAEVFLGNNVPNRQAEQLATFITLLQLGSHYPSTPADSPAFSYQRGVWFASCDHAWQQWIARTPPNVTALSPRDIIQFSCIERLADISLPDLWHGHEDHLQTLLACEDTPPALIQQWMHSAPWMAQLLSAPDTTVHQASCARVFSSLPDSAAKRA